ncbi:MAG: DNA-binding protein WhiA [Clostridia bacterium]|nr:DNA-binding protein WhiA [Clostridia bacterium]
MNFTNFTEEIKAEIIKNFPGERQCSLSALSAFIRTSGSLLVENGFYGFELSTESQLTAHFFAELIERYLDVDVDGFHSSSDVASGKDKLCFTCVNSRTGELMKELGILSEDNGELFIDFTIKPELTASEESSAAYVAGAFLGGGSCTIPDFHSHSRTGYHLETVFRNKVTADDFANVLCGFDLLPKLVTRKENVVVYFKSREAIADMLNVMGAEGCLEKLDKIAEHKDELNNANRVSNCSVSNIDKAVTASVKQVCAIEVIRSTIGLQSLDEQLFSVAEGRLADKNASMQELADRLNISKSCINHRMRKIIEIANSLSQD